MKGRELLQLLKNTFLEFVRERPMHHGAALSYYAIMALVPILYLSVSFFGSFVGQQTMLDIIAEVLQEQIGIEDVDGIIEFLGTVNLSSGNTLMRILGIAALMLSCTAILNSLKRSINSFYKVKKKSVGSKKLILQTLIFRGVSMLSIAAVTSIVIALYFAETFILTMEEQYFSDLEVISWVFSNFASHGIPIVLNILVFTLIFKYLHDAVVEWRVAWVGGIVTGIFLYLGQLLIKFYLGNYFFAAESGVAGTLLVILVWVYYSSQILFLGSKFSFVYAKYRGTPIERAV